MTVGDLRKALKAHADGDLVVLYSDGLCRYFDTDEVYAVSLRRRVEDRELIHPDMDGGGELIKAAAIE